LAQHEQKAREYFERKPECWSVFHAWEAIKGQSPGAATSSTDDNGKTETPKRRSATRVIHKAVTQYTAQAANPQDADPRSTAPAADPTATAQDVDPTKKVATAFGGILDDLAGPTITVDSLTDTPTPAPAAEPDPASDPAPTADPIPLTDRLRTWLEDQPESDDENHRSPGRQPRGSPTAEVNVNRR
jgi:hypothetical protein